MRGDIIKLKHKSGNGGVQLMRFKLSANDQAAELFPQLVAGLERQCSGDIFERWLQGKEVDQPSLDKMFDVFQMLSSPLQLYNRTKLSASGTVLDFKALTRFYASGCTDMRIWKARVGADQSFRLVLRFGDPVLQKCCEQLLTQKLETVSAENGHHLTPTDPGSFILSTGRAQHNTRVELELEVSAEGDAEMAPDAETTTASNYLVAENMILQLERDISGPENLRIMEGAVLKKSKERSPWAIQPETKMYTGKPLQQIVDVVGFAVVPGVCKDRNVTVMEALQLMHDQKLEPYLMGGFVRDILMNKPSDDIDLTLACTYEQLLGFAREVDSEGWLLSLKEDGQKIALNQAKSPSYFNIGDQTKPFALEGKAWPVNEAGERELPLKDFTINEFMYDPINHELIDPSGRGLEDARKRKLRISEGWDLDEWVHGLSKHPFAHLFRWYKFRGRGYSPADPVQRKWIVDTLTASSADEAMRKTFKYFLQKEFVAKQQGKSVDERKQVGDKLALRFLTGLVEDVEDVIGQGIDGRAWCKKNFMEWLPAELQMYFESAMEKGKAAKENAETMESAADAWTRKWTRARFGESERGVDESSKEDVEELEAGAIEASVSAGHGAEGAKKAADDVTEAVEEAVMDTGGGSSMMQLDSPLGPPTSPVDESAIKAIQAFGSIGRRHLMSREEKDVVHEMLREKDKRSLCVRLHTLFDPNAPDLSEENMQEALDLIGAGEWALHARRQHAGWVHEPSEYRFTNLFQWFKLRGRGFIPAGSNHQKWMVDTLTANIAKTDLRETFKHCFIEQFKEKQQGKPDEERKQVGDKLALRFVTGLVEDVEKVLGKGTDGIKWFKENIIEWLPASLQSYFESAVAWSRCIHCQGPVCKFTAQGGGKFEGRYIEIAGKGKVHEECRTDYRQQQAPKCLHCQGPVCKVEGKFDGRYTETAGKGKVHAECYSDYIQQHAPKCLHCQSPVCEVEGKFEGESFDIKGKGKVHAECYADYVPKCLHCQGPVCKVEGKFEGESFDIKGKGNVHTECYTDYRQQQAPKCLHCQGPMCVIEGKFEGRYIEIAGKGEVHAECRTDYTAAGAKISST
jgi:cytoskeletal protein CcmA (bactofilin family)